ncbi:MAG: bifunctional N-acetylglucosamine-1-phosphate uridyltransferase/glucosamine-1-phosphate acetyltransferase [Rhodobacteraceae bacterium]|nr:bifunctional N-acetylglucosamine-1-phosphate uridyltransferase/glucosamine-1-phosphate acetyltransferase [Paracoccaceae bacterium]
MSIAIVILAAGKGTRMLSDLPKALHKIGHATLLEHVMLSASTLEPAKTIVVVGHEAKMVADLARDIDDAVIIVEQKEQLGTAHAVSQAKEILNGFNGDILVLYADTPFIKPETINSIKEARKTADLVVLGFDSKDPGRYGRIIANGRHIRKIVEFKDASEAEREVTLCNSGVMAGPASLIISLIGQIKNENAAGEYYLTDCIELANAQRKSAMVVRCSETETLGVNSRRDLALAEAEFQKKARQDHIENGVTLLAPNTVFFALDTDIGPDAIVEQNVVFGPNVTIESGANIKPFSHLEGTHISKGAVVGPFARLRPGSEIGEHATVGNFVEVKNAIIGDKSKINHLSYLGDAKVGKSANIGAGSITCNYDGVMKHHTKIGDGAFIGSNTMMVAPITIGKDAMTASGSVITKDVPEEALALGRGTQENKPRLGRKLMKIFKQRKQKKDIG